MGAGDFPQNDRFDSGLAALLSSLSNSGTSRQVLGLPLALKHGFPLVHLLPQSQVHAPHHLIQPRSRLDFSIWIQSLVLAQNIAVQKLHQAERRLLLCRAVAQP